jgi:hypothetical protein
MASDSAVVSATASLEHVLGILSKQFGQETWQADENDNISRFWADPAEAKQSQALPIYSYFISCKKSSVICRFVEFDSLGFCTSVGKF